MRQQPVVPVANNGNALSSAYTRYVLFMIFLLSVFNTCDRTIVSVMVDDIKTDLSLSDRQMGFIMGFAFALVHFVATIPFARLADRWSRPRIMALGLFSWSMMTAVCGLAQNFMQMAAARMGVGIGEAAGGPPAQAMIAEYVEPEKRGRAMSIITLGALVGLSFGVVYGGWASEHHGWRFALISVGLAGSFLSLLFWFTVADRRSQAHSAQTAPDLLQTLRILAGNRAFVLLVLAACAVSMGAYGRALWDPTFLRRVYGMGPAEAGGWYFLIGPLPSALGALVTGFLIDRLAHRDPRWYAWLPGLGALLLIPSICLFYLLPAGGAMIGSMPATFIFSILASLLSTTWVPTTMCLAQSLSPPHSLAVTAAVWSMLSNFLGYGLGPLLVGDANVRLEGLYGEDAIRYSLVATSGMTVVGAALYFGVAANLRKSASQ